MSEKQKTLTVTILDREYRVACPTGQEHQLRNAANTLNDKMQEIRDTGKVFGIERIAVMAALNLTHELLQSRPDNDGDLQTLQRLTAKIDSALPTAPETQAEPEFQLSDDKPF
ncbi:cell division protein ZapA [Reinekea marinisedimentorum]|uniref:Cell division protein ZapA n=1 Tax=Reinekea marinisedimentorum TaxID=230495 RepID=A0A4R3IBA5_9GAMM|nr:cell division protein ZapA [Reinekea marinisedimentorum]TCS43741.1 cell division protein ZapA [Reinekea marinisedimentorum]